MNHKQIRKLIDKKLKDVGMWSTEAVELVFLTGLTESGYEYIDQLGSGPAKSFFQIEPATAHDICDNYLKFRPGKVKSMSEATGIAESIIGSSKPEYWKDILEYNMAAGIILCRYKYWRVPKSIPKEIESMGEYWKKYYNTAGGKGSKEHFLAKAATRKDV